MSKPRQLLLSLLAAFILLAIWVSKYPVNHLDIGISHFIQQFHGPALDKIMIAISAFGDMPVALYCMAGTAFLFFIFKFKREALFILSISFSGIITFGLKHLFSRPRPTSEYVG